MSHRRGLLPLASHVSIGEMSRNGSGANGFTTPGRELAALRDYAMLALATAGLSSREISRLEICDLRVYETGKVSVRIWLEGTAPRYVVIDGEAARHLDRHVSTRVAAGATSRSPLFAGRRSGAGLTRVAISNALRDLDGSTERRVR